MARLKPCAFIDEPQVLWLRLRMTQLLIMKVQPLTQRSHRDQKLLELPKVQRSVLTHKCHPEHREGSAVKTMGRPQSSLRSLQVALVSSINSIFLGRRQPFNSFSRAMAAPTLLYWSNQTRRLQL